MSAILPILEALKMNDGMLGYPALKDEIQRFTADAMILENRKQNLRTTLAHAAKMGYINPFEYVKLLHKLIGYP